MFLIITVTWINHRLSCPLLTKCCTDKWNSLFLSRPLAFFIRLNWLYILEWMFSFQIPTNIRSTELMTSTDTQSVIKRSIKPKTQYSPSEPSAIALYHLINNDDTRTMVIVANSSVKKITNGGAVVLNDNRTAKLIMSGENFRVRQNDEHCLTESCCFCHLGPKAKCLERWNRQKRSSQCE